MKRIELVVIFQKVYKSKLIIYKQLIFKIMSKKKITPKDDRANQQNANKGTKGTNKQYDQNQGNKGKQQNPNQKKK